MEKVNIQDFTHGIAWQWGWQNIDQETLKNLSGGAENLYPALTTLTYIGLG